MNDRVFYAATKILAESCSGGKGEGLHKSPAHVATAVDLAELLVAEIDKREAAADAARPPLPEPTSGGASTPPVIVPPVAK